MKCTKCFLNNRSEIDMSRFCSCCHWPKLKLKYGPLINIHDQEISQDPRFQKFQIKLIKDFLAEPKFFDPMKPWFFLPTIIRETYMAASQYFDEYYNNLFNLGNLKTAFYKFTLFQNMLLIQFWLEKVQVDESMVNKKKLKQVLIGLINQHYENGS